MLEPGGASIDLIDSGGTEFSTVSLQSSGIVGGDLDLVPVLPLLVPTVRDDVKRGETTVGRRPEDV